MNEPSHHNHRQEQWQGRPVEEYHHHSLERKVNCQLVLHPGKPVNTLHDNNPPHVTQVKCVQCRGVYLLQQALTGLTGPLSTQYENYFLSCPVPPAAAPEAVHDLQVPQTRRVPTAGWPRHRGGGRVCLGYVHRPTVYCKTVTRVRLSVRYISAECQLV
jgi:hypothetical protein